MRAALVAAARACRARVHRVDAGRAVRLQPVRARRRDGDRRQAAGGRAVHRAALPAPGSAACSATSCARCARPAWRSICATIVRHLDPANLELLVRELPRTQARATRGLSGLADDAPARRHLPACATGWRSSPSRMSARWLEPRARGRRARSVCSRRCRPGGRVLRSRRRQPPAAHADARCGDRAGSADDRRLRCKASPSADDRRDRRVLDDRAPSRWCDCSGERARPASAWCWARRS